MNARTAADPTNRCRGVELPERALMVAARMLQNARLAAVLASAAAREQHTTVPAPDAKTILGTARYLSSGSLTAASAASESAASTKPGGGGSSGGGITKPNNIPKKQMGRNGKPPVSREDFERTLAVCQLPYSRTWADAAYELCLGEVALKGEADATGATGAAIVAAGNVGASGRGKAKSKRGKVVRTREQFWATFGAALVGVSEDCDDLLCG